MIRVLRMNVINNEKVKAFADVEVNELRISGLKVIQSETELYVAYPTEKGKDDKYYSIISPVTQELEEEIKKVVLDYYNKKK